MWKIFKVFCNILMFDGISMEQLCNAALDTTEINLLNYDDARKNLREHEIQYV